MGGGWGEGSKISFYTGWGGGLSKWELCLTGLTILGEEKIYKNVGLKIAIRQTKYNVLTKIVSY